MKRLKMVQPLRERDFALFWSGMSVSMLGDGLFAVALAWQVYELRNVPTALAVVGVAESVPLVGFVLVGGVVSDRVERRRVLAAASLLRGAGVALLGALAIVDALELWHIVAIAVVYGAGQAFSGPAQGSIIPDLVPQELLVQANSLWAFVRPLAFRLIGPALGGVIVHQVGPGTAFVVDAATFAFAATMLSLVSPRPAALLSEGPTSLRRDIGEGLRFVRSHVWLWGTLSWAAVALLVSYAPFQVLMPYLVKNELGGSAGDLGLVFAAGGLGAVVTSLVIGQVGLPRKHITLMYGVWAMGTFDLALYTVARVPWHAMLVALYAEACWAIGLLVWATLMQRLVPTELLGRVKSIDWLLSLGLSPLSFALVGPFAQWFGAENVLIACGVGGSLLTVGVYFLPGMRDTEREGSASRVVLGRPSEAV